MTMVQIVMQVVLVCLTSFGISSLMEYYKKNIRKDKASVWEIRGIAAALSIVAAVAFKLTGLMMPILSYFFPNVTAWLDALLYAVVIFVLQFFADKGVIKAVVKFATTQITTSETEITDEIKRLLNSVKTNTNVDPTTIASALKFLGVTEEKMTELFKEVGMDEEVAKKIAEAYQKAVIPTVESDTVEKVEDKTIEESK